ncbi:DUF4296 domain-containing protein [Flavobacteriaceae bacterium GSB9]|nr:DUF4296 domain-containing protein [Flavobacteriaceae bacterium GSB9]
MIFRKLMLCLGLVFVVVGCNNIKSPEKPENLISKKEMVNILIDAKLITAASSVNKRMMRDSGVVVSSYVFKKYNIDSLQFVESNNYYAFHLKDYEAIYAQVSDSLEKLKEALKEQEAEEWKVQTKREEDSLKAVKKDSIRPLKATDSLVRSAKRDSLTELFLEKKVSKKEMLPSPVSDIVSP